MELLLENFWNEKFWLAGNTTWKDVEPGIREGVIYRKYHDLFWSLPLVLVIVVIRSACVKCFFIPLGRLLGIRSRKVKTPFDNAVLEKMYRKCHDIPSEMELSSLQKQTDLSTRDIERWWRKRRAHDRPTTLEKFSENCWRFTFYTVNFILGLSILWDKSWTWNFIDMFRDYPKHSLDDGIWWYYNITLAFYIFLTVFHFFEGRRKDFWQMFIHHLVAVFLILVSWTVNAIRGGSLIVFIHDIADVLLEGVKAIKYAKYDRLGSVLFVLFSITWVVTRLGVFSSIVHFGIFKFPTLFPVYPLYYLLAGLHIFLLVLHVAWTYMIFKVLYRMYAKNKLDDVRSSSEEELGSGCSSESGLKSNGNSCAVH